MRVKDIEKVDLKLNIQKTKIMESGPIVSWQMEGGKVEAVTDLIFLGSKITAASDFSHEIKGHVLLGRKAMTNLNSVLKSRDITLLIKVHIVQGTLKSLLQHHSSKASILWHSAFFVVQLSHPHMSTGKTHL